MGDRKSKLRGSRAVAAVLVAGWVAAHVGGCGSSSSSGLGSKVTDGIGGGSGASGDGSAGGAGSGKGGSAGTGVLFGRDGGVFRESGVNKGPDASCGTTAVGAVARDVNVLLVIDESGSMADTPTGFASDKWTALKSAVSGALGATKSSIAFGLELFPASKDPTKAIPVACTTECCDMPAAPGITVPVEPGASGVPKIIAAINAAAPGGGTPTAVALQNAYDYFTSGAGKSLKGDKYVLLATDGGPNCNEALTPACTAAACTTNLDGKCTLASGTNCCDAQFGGGAAIGRCLDDVSTTAKITALSGAGVKTFVVGIPGSEIYKTSLDAFAVAGGEENTQGPPKYYAVSATGGVAGLSAVLEAITKQLVTTCSLKLTSPPPSLDLLNVKVDGALVPQGPDGWTLDKTTTPPTVNLRGAVCKAVETTGAQSVQVVYGCPTVITR
jgi:hypothetical protein